MLHTLPHGRDFTLDPNQKMKSAGASFVMMYMAQHHAQKKGGLILDQATSLSLCRLMQSLVMLAL